MKLFILYHFKSYLYYFVYILLPVYVFLRSITMSVTHDEAQTYFWHITSNWYEILSYTSSGLLDNNHVLYTLPAKLFITIFGLSDFALRLPATISSMFYSTGLFIKRIKYIVFDEVSFL